MKLYVCVDDTDDLTKSTSTGKISDLIGNRIVEMGGVMEQGITSYTTEQPTYTNERFSTRLNSDRQHTSAIPIIIIASTTAARAFPCE